MTSEIRRTRAMVDPLETWLARHPAEPDVTIPTADRNRPLTASHAQQGMWLAHEVGATDDRALTAAHAYRLVGDLRIPALAAALTALVTRHEVLRTCFAVHDDELRQVITSPAPLTLDPEQVTDPAQLRTRLRAFVDLRFDLDRDLPLRVRLFRVAEREHVLVTVFHHIANDGWSMDIFHRELAALYEAANALPMNVATGTLVELAALPELVVQYPDYAVWQRTLTGSGWFDPSLAHWRSRLDGVPALLDLPTDLPRPDVRASTGGRVTCPIPAATSAAVADTATRYGTTPFAVQFTAFQLLLSAWSGQDELVLGSTTANRTLPETEALIGFFANVLPIRTHRTAGESFAEVLARTATALVEAYGHEDTPFELLLQQLPLPRSTGHNPLVQVTVASHQELTAPLTLAGLTVEYLPPDAVDVQEDLTLYLTSGRGGGTCHLDYRTDLFHRPTIERLAGAYLRTLDLVCADPQAATDHLVGPLAPARPAPPVPAPPTPAPPGGQPRGVAEKLVADVWSQVLRRAPIHRDDNFFTIGGTSLAASRVANRLSSQLGLQLPVRAIFLHSSLTQLAAHVEALIRDAMAAELVTGAAPAEVVAADWLWDLTRPATPVATLVLLPHAGGSAQSYRDWAHWLPADVRVVAAQYPGRGPRYDEPPAHDIAALADPLAAALAGLDTPVHVFGHSLGALLGFEVCWRLQQAGRPAAALYASSAAAPHVYRAVPVRPEGLTNAELVAALEQRGGMPRDLLDHPDLVDLVIDACRADIAVTESYRYGPTVRRLDCPVIAFGGDRDPSVPQADLHRWQDLTTVRPISTHIHPGGHFYLYDNMAPVTATIRRQLRPVAADPAQSTGRTPR